MNVQNIQKAVLLLMPAFFGLVGVAIGYYLKDDTQSVTSSELQSSTQLLADLEAATERNRQLEAYSQELSLMLRELLEKLKTSRAFEEAQVETSLRPDFDPTLGGVPYPGMNSNNGVGEQPQTDQTQRQQTGNE